MGKYLKKFADKISKKQSSQILRLLNKQRNTGQIRSVQEFTDKLQSLVNELTSTNLKPSLSLWEAEIGDTTSSETHNFMLDRVQDDLAASFEETINIDEVQRSHEAIIKDVILKNLKSGVAELESKITLYEIINQNTKGFDAAIFSTFRETKSNRTQQGGIESEILFVDPRTADQIDTSEDASVDLIGERLTLGLNQKTYHSISNARQIFDSEASQSELVVEDPSLSLSNAIDDTKGTFWIQNLLFQRQREDVKVKVEIDFGAIREINFLELEPALQLPVSLEDVSYLNSNQSLVSLGLDEQDITGTLSLVFRKIATNKLYLTFRNENGRRTNFHYDPNFVKFSHQKADPSLVTKQVIKTTVNEAAHKLIPSGKVRRILRIDSATVPQTFRGYQFTFGMDNIRAGVADYDSRSIYVSSPLDNTGIGVLGLKTLEQRPYLEKSSGTIRFTSTGYDINEDSSLVDDSALAVGETSRTLFLGSLEYWIIEQEFNNGNALINTNVYPMLPLGKNRIEHERLVLSERSSTTAPFSDVGSFMFYTTLTDGDIKVYKNGVLLEDVTGDLTPTDGWVNITAADNKLPNNNQRMTFKVRIYGALQEDILTVSYAPVESSTKTIPKNLSAFDTVGGQQVVDLVGDLSARLAEGKTVVLDKFKNNEANIKSQVYLAIVLRNNSAQSSLSAAVEEYTLLSGSKNNSKFESI